MRRNKALDIMLEDSKMHKSSTSNYGVSYSRLNSLRGGSPHSENYGSNLSALGVRTHSRRWRTYRNA